MNRLMAVLTVTLLGPCAAASAQDPKQLDTKVIAAWQVAGAEVGWYGRSKNGGEGYTIGKPDDDKALPAIALWWKPRGIPGRTSLNPVCSAGYSMYPLHPHAPGNQLQGLPVDLSTLPAPTVPFALFLDTMMVKDSLTDAGMRDIARFKTLQYLSISSALNLGGLQISDAGLKPLGKLQGLRYLILNGQTKVRDAGMKDLAQLKNLRILGLTGTGVTDAGLKELAGLENLEALHLGWTRVTDAGLKELSGMKSLKSLVLPNTKVTEAGVAQLQKALPKLTLFR
jgi:hypothetical protein